MSCYIKMLQKFSQKLKNSITAQDQLLSSERSPKKERDESWKPLFMRLVVQHYLNLPRKKNSLLCKIKRDLSSTKMMLFMALLYLLMPQLHCCVQQKSTTQKASFAIIFIISSRAPLGIQKAHFNVVQPKTVKCASLAVIISARGLIFMRYMTLRGFFNTKVHFAIAVPQF